MATMSRNRLRDIIGRRRPSDLIIDDPQWRLCLREPQDRPHEILPVCRKDPARSQDDMVRQSLPYRDLAGELALAVDIERPWRIVLSRRLMALAIKDLVGRKMSKGDAGCGAGCGDIAG